MDPITVKVDGETKELVIRSGQALPLKEPLPVNISGTIKSPLKYLEKRIGEINQLKSVLEVDKEGMQLNLVIDESNHYGTSVKGSLTLDPKFKLFGINKGNYMSPFALADMIKMNRSCFENHTVAMELVNELKNFKAKVDKEIEKSDNNRGNRKLLIDQVVKSNVPEKFNMKIPIFKGEKPQVFEVEVYFNSEDLTCCLISPQANDLIDEQVDQIIGEVVTGIEVIAPNLVIIEV